MSTQRTAHVPINGEAPNSYSRMESLLYREDGKWVSGRKVARNTYLERRGGLSGIALKLHNTDILLWRTDNTVELSSGGWLTTTTRGRINEWLPKETGTGRMAQVWSDRGYWMVSFKSHEDRAKGNRHVSLPELDTVPYHDGLTIDLATLTEFSPRYDDSEDRAWNSLVDKNLVVYLRDVKGVDTTRVNAPRKDIEEARRVLGGVLGVYDDQIKPEKLPPGFFLEMLRQYGIRSNTHLYTPRRAPGGNVEMSESTLRLFKDDLRKLFRGVLYHGYHARRITK